MYFPRIHRRCAWVALCFLLAFAPTVLGGSASLPAAVKQSADAYLKTLPVVKRPFARKAYIDGFLDGYKHLQYAYGEDTPSANGQAAGRRHYLEHPEKRAEIFKALGYNFVAAEGTYESRYEVSAFYRGRLDASAWWIMPLCDVAPGISKAAERPNRGVRVRVTGYLSPTSPYNYGHLNQYQHEFFAAEIMRP